ncbi:hypothetical protein L6164_035157 [Bauhinia variegata]|uniref:Uncharacterized protein n=1 Tax=Bauhinia variegata TaxID=167791 RepID=A0ACB9KXL6_BAUVA|nr:hypothetical protein L6164_035157 [Bauhinia variegata]
MKISSATVSLSSSIPRPLVVLPFSSSTSTLFLNNSTSTFLKKARICISNTPSCTRIRTTTKKSQKGLTCNALFGLGVPELVVIAGVAVLVFGPKQLPEIGKSIGKTVKSFQQAAKEFESELKKEPDSTEEPPVDTPVVVASEQEKQDTEMSS